MFTSFVFKKISRQFHKPTLLHLYRTMSVESSYLKYSEYGEPAKVVERFTETLNDPTDKQVLVKMLASPINPADINLIEGKYPSISKPPIIPGNEAVGEVISCGPNVSNLKSGDYVIPFSIQLGTWRTYGIYNEQDLLQVPSTLGIVEAATITVNPPTAYRMLKDFVKLAPGDTVIQNGSNSAVGQAVFQLCKLWGFNCIGIVRDRPEINNLKDFLKELGAAEVLTEEEIRKTDIFKSGKYPRPKLAFNCVGGKSATEIIRHLDNKGTMVTYGGMAREPVVVPTASLIFKDITFKGFWMSRWSQENINSDARHEMFNEFINFYLNGQLKGPVFRSVSFNDYKQALSAALDVKGFIGEKLIFDFSK